jgi:hypothetical protein
MEIGPLQDYVHEMRDTLSVLESYSQLATFTPDKDTTTVQQAGAFLFMVYQQQLIIVDSMDVSDGPIHENVQELRDTMSVLESYAQLATFTPTLDVTTVRQAGAFMFMVYERQMTIINSMEAALADLEKKR